MASDPPYSLDWTRVKQSSQTASTDCTMVQECNCLRSVQRVVKKEDGINFLDDRRDRRGNIIIMAGMEMKRNVILQTRLDMGDETELVPTSDT